MSAINLNETPLGSLKHLGFKRYAPHPHLRLWVQCYWTIDRQLPDAGFTENLYPDGGSGLIIDLKPQTLVDMRFNAHQTTSKIHLSGQIKRMGVRFHPGGAFQLLALEMPDVVGGEFLPDHLGNKPLLELQEQLSLASTSAVQLGLLDDWLLQQAARLQARTGLIQQMLPLMMGSSASIETLSAQTSLSRRQLERRFVQEVGLTPGRLKQLLRVRRARQLISDTPDIVLADVALDAGFYDQAHFIRQFQQITGQTPGQYRTKKMSQKYNTP